MRYRRRARTRTPGRRREPRQTLPQRAARSGGAGSRIHHDEAVEALERLILGRLTSAACGPDVPRVPPGKKVLCLATVRPSFADDQLGGLRPRREDLLRPTEELDVVEGR